jgi:hypothetical protein
MSGKVDGWPVVGVDGRDLTERTKRSGTRKALLFYFAFHISLSSLRALRGVALRGGRRPR